MAAIAIDIDDAYLTRLGKTPEEQQRFIMESVGCEAYRVDRLSGPAVRDMLGLRRLPLRALFVERQVPSKDSYGPAFMTSHVRQQVREYTGLGAEAVRDFADKNHDWIKVVAQISKKGGEANDVGNVYQLPLQTGERS
jgi:hypothetical protein